MHRALLGCVALGWAGFAALPALGAPEERRICPGIVLRGEIDPGLSDMERRLVCGDPNPKEANTDRLKFDDAWKKIPAPQARYGLKNFLQDRGHFHPRFERQGETMIVELGPVARVTRFEVVGAPETLEPDRRRKLVGEKLTPAILDVAESWVKHRLEALGYPCPKLTTEADPDTGVLRVGVEPGPLQNLVEVIERDLPGIQGGVLRRYDAFQLGKPYSGDLLRVTENRVTSLGLFQSIRFVGACGERGATARQEIVAGPPRLLRFGVGLDTEGVVRVRASWRNTRLGAMSSWFDITAQGSAKDQTLDLSFNWYHLAEPSRQSLRPSLRIRHGNEEFYEFLQARGQFAYSTTYDSQEIGLSLLSGPTFEELRTLRGVGPTSSRFTSWESRVQAQSHYHELFLSSPRTGWQSSVMAAFNSRSLASSLTAQRMAWDGRALWNWRELDPPLWVFGARWGFRTVVTGEDVTGVPPTFRQYLGGTADLRGFGRQEVPGPNGSLSSGFVSLEARLVETLPIGFEPFAFIDFGKTGVKPFSFDSPLFRSPGLGIRWASPIGAFRTTIARGLASGIEPRWQFYLSYGEEF
jgi:translocation and assembly module TamA